MCDQEVMREPICCGQRHWVVTLSAVKRIVFVPAVAALSPLRWDTGRPGGSVPRRCDETRRRFKAVRKSLVGRCFRTAAFVR
jgi:hypothetical protein